MKRFFLLLPILMFLCANVHAQVVDTVLFEDFQGDVDPTEDWLLFPLGNDTTWVNLDEDGLVPFDGEDYSYRWFATEFFVDATDSVTGITNYCIASLSYMQDFLPGNRNWIITPPIQVTDDSYTLHWKSAPFQLPRYMDGYSVWLSTNGNDLFGASNPFTNLLFRAASMEAITGEGESIDLSNFAFTPGYIHADSLRDEEYFRLWEPGDSTLCRGYLEPHSVSLAAYTGQTVYIAFLHDSDDDYYLAMDDFLITRTPASGVSWLEQDLRLRTFPNPADRYLNVLFRLQESTRVTLQVHNINGQLVWQQSGNMASGEQMLDIQLAHWPAGAYTLSLQTPQGTLSRPFVKK